MRKTTLILSFLVCTFTGLGTVQAQSIDQALTLYKAQEYPDAAIALYAVMSEHPELDVRDQAQIYLAETLFKMERQLDPAQLEPTFVTDGRKYKVRTHAHPTACRKPLFMCSCDYVLMIIIL